RLVRGHGCRYRTFLYRIILWRFKNFVRAREQWRQRLEVSEPVMHWLDGRSSPALGVSAIVGRAGRREAADAACQAEAAEQRALLREAIEELDEPSRRLWDALTAGQTLRDIAAELGISYDVVRRRRSRLIAVLALRVRGEARTL